MSRVDTPQDLDVELSTYIADIDDIKKPSDTGGGGGGKGQYRLESKLTYNFLRGDLQIIYELHIKN